MALNIKRFNHEVNEGRISFVAETHNREEIEILVEMSNYGYTYELDEEDERLNDDDYEALEKFIEACGELVTG